MFCCHGLSSPHQCPLLPSLQLQKKKNIFLLSKENIPIMLPAFSCGKETDTRPFQARVSLPQGLKCLLFSSLSCCCFYCRSWQKQKLDDGAALKIAHRQHKPAQSFFILQSPGPNGSLIQRDVPLLPQSIVSLYFLHGDYPFLKIIDGGNIHSLKEKAYIHSNSKPNCCPLAPIIQSQNGIIVACFPKSGSSLLSMVTFSHLCFLLLLFLRCRDL